MLNGIESAKNVRHADLEKPVTTLIRDARATETTEPAPTSLSDKRVALLKVK
jgi:hypothetical protein